MNSVGPLGDNKAFDVSEAASLPFGQPARAPAVKAVASSGAKYLLICNTADGLVAQLNGVVVQLQFARRLGLQPIVYLHGRSNMFGGPNPYFDADNGPNVWDYYYEPIGPSADHLPALIRAGQVYTLATASDLVRLFRWEPRSWFMNPYDYYRSVENYADGDYPVEWWEEQREKARDFLRDETIRFKPAILEQVRLFIEKNFSEDTLGLQLRGSDKFDFGVGPNLSRKVEPEEYSPHIDRYLAEHPKCSRIFVATDQRQWLNTLEQAYPGRIVSFSEWSLSDSDQNRFHDDGAKAARGVEVIVDLLLLSRCNYILKCHAAVGEMAVTLNPDLGFLDLNYAAQMFEARSRPVRSVCAPAVRILSAAWRRLAESGLGLIQVVSLNGDEVIVDPEHPRSLNVKVEANEKAPRAPLLSGRFASGSLASALSFLASRCFAYEKRGTELCGGKSP
jgi:hypothetical protein